MWASFKCDGIDTFDSLFDLAAGPPCTNTDCSIATLSLTLALYKSNPLILRLSWSSHQADVRQLSGSRQVVVRQSSGSLFADLMKTKTFSALFEPRKWKNPGGHSITMWTRFCPFSTTYLHTLSWTSDSNWNFLTT